MTAADTGTAAPKGAAIAALNDRFRRATYRTDADGHTLGRKVFTRGIAALDIGHQVAIAERVISFNEFTEDNDPYGEHDFGAFDYNGQRFFWKIDYYDRASFAAGNEYGADNPADAASTLRVLTVMLAEEY